MDLNVWTSTELVKADFDDAAKQWKATVRTKGQEDRVIKARQLVIATGLGGSKPYMPAPRPGQDSFKGLIHHGFDFKSGKPWRGKKVCCP
jgi:putative flavoprotein involved in K+ transport